MSGLGQARPLPAARPARPVAAARRSLRWCRRFGGLVLDLLHVLLHEAVAHEFPARLLRGAGDLRVGGGGRPLRQAPPGCGTRRALPACARSRRECRIRARTNWECRAWASAHRRRQHGARHRLADVPYLDVDDHPHGEARAVGKRQEVAARRLPSRRGVRWAARAISPKMQSSPAPASHEVAYEGGEAWAYRP